MFHINVHIAKPFKPIFQIQRPLLCASQSQIVNQHTCEFIIQYQNQMNCSCAQYYGIQSYAPENLPHCTPALALKVDFFSTLDSKNKQKSRNCLPLCYEEFSKFSSTVAKIAGSEIPNQHLPSYLDEKIQRWAYILLVTFFFNQFFYIDLLQRWLVFH